MRFLVDENAGVFVARWLRDRGYEVFSIYEQARGIDDDKIIKMAFAENWITITSDKDFGEKVYRERYPHRGIVLLRLDDECSANKIIVLQQLLAAYLDRLADSFVVVTETRTRFARSR